MIPTREQIDEHYSVNALAWLRAMRDEIDHLTFMGGLATKALTDAGWTLTGVEWKPPIGPNPSPLLEQIDRLTAENARLQAESDGYQHLAEETQKSQDKSSLVVRANGTEFRVYGPNAGAEERFAKTFADYWKLINVVAESLESTEKVKALTAEVATLGEFNAAALSEQSKLRADLDRANTEAALARDAMAKATTDTRAKVQNELRSVERALCSADVLIRYAPMARGTYECHVKNTIETAIDALRDDSATPPYSPPFEGDPKDCAFKATVGDAEGSFAFLESEPNLYDPKPAPVEQPAAAVPDHFPDAGKMVPDDPRWELVAQLAELMVPLSQNCDNIRKARAIAAKLRGGA